MKEIVRGQALSLRYPYASKLTLQEISLTLHRGERVLLLGPSGSGKSSLALCLNSLIPHSIEAELGGSLVVFGQKTLDTTLAYLAKYVGIVFQDPESQFCTLTVEDEIAFGLENLKVSRSKIEKRIVGALQQVGMVEHIHTRLDRLSGGMKQRAALAAILAMDPDLLILDEVTSHLDPAGATQVFTLIEQLTSENPERTFLIIEHHLDSLITFINRVWVLDEEGQLRYNAPPRFLFAQYGQVLEKTGIWQPAAMNLAHYLREAGIKLPLWPLTIQEAITGLHACPEAWPVAEAWSTPGSEREFDLQDEPMMQLRDVMFTYPNGTRAINGINLDIRCGEILALIGSNGAGKTTLAQIMVGLLRHQKGKVHIHGKDISSFSDRELVRRCGFVFQNPEHQFVTDQVFDEIAFSLRKEGVSEENIIKRVESLLNRFGLAGRRNANPFELSQGQKRRLSVATMLVSNKSLLIFDEPTFGQDASNTRELVAELRRLNQEGMTLVLVTHDMELVWELAHRVAVMFQGRISKIGSVTEIFAELDLLRQAHIERPLRALVATALQAIKSEKRRI